MGPEIIAIIISVISAVIAAVSTIFARKTYLQLKEKEKFERYLLFVKEFESAEMFSAYNRLYSLEEPVEETYNANVKTEKIPGPLPVPETLPFQRRIVAHFFHRMYIALVSDLLPETLTYKFWADIPKVIGILEAIGQDTGKHLPELRLKVENYNSRDIHIT